MLALASLAFALGGCASVQPVDPNDETRSLVFGRFDMKDAPSGLQWVSIRSDDAAVYIGTLRVHRDGFNEVARFEILDESAKAAEDFRRFGANAGFRKALARLERPAE